MKIEVYGERKKIDVSYVPYEAIAVVGDTWHFERRLNQVFLVETWVE